MSNRDKKEGTITLAQAKSIESQMRGMLAGLDESEAEWLRRNFERVENFIRRRPEDGLLTRELRGVYTVAAFEPRIASLSEAGLLKYQPSDYTSESRDELFPGAYDGPAKVRFEMHAYAAGGPPYREKGMYNTQTGLPRIAIDLRARGYRLADFHQAATFAAAVARHLEPERWIGEYGPCRLYALGTQRRCDANGVGMIPVLLSPGTEDRRSDEKRWRLDYDFIDRDGYRRPDAWFLTVAPAD